MALKISLIICTHNPQTDYLRRTLEALKVQTLPKEEWELLLIDNACNEPLADKWDLSGHSHGRHIREDKLGLTPARLRGIEESSGEILVFVDDDNLLAPDFLETCLNVVAAHPFIGAFGGLIEPEFEKPPPEWTRPFWPWLALGGPPRPLWGNGFAIENTPLGAGLCVRSEVAARYLERVRADPQRAKFDRRGMSLVSGGDIDLAYTAIELGFGTGRFPSLRVTHVIPPERLEETYLLRLGENVAYSNVLLAARWTPERVRHRVWRSSVADGLRYLLMTPRQKRFRHAKRRGELRGRRELGLT